MSPVLGKRYERSLTNNGRILGDHVNPQPATSQLFHESLVRLGNQLREQLAETRAGLRHPGDKGSHAEEAFRQLLRRYLPRRFAIGQGEVIDTENRRSGQTDVLVVNEDQPFIYPEEEPGLFLIEGIDAGAEVKSVITSEEFERSIANSQKFKALQALSTPGMRMAKPSDIARFHERRPWFLFAYESQLTLETIAERLIRAAESLGPKGDLQVDAVFVLDRGSVINLGDGNGSFGVVKEDGSRRSGWIIHPSDQALYSLISWLSIVMPRVHRLTPILPEYLVSILT